MLSVPGIPRSQKGAPNGVAALDGTGKVLASELPVIGTPLDEWNATTNTPTLADGVGTAGDLYVANVAGTQNLGSGSNTYAIGDFVSYTGTKWIKIARDVASTGANPSATVGLAAKNGSALTFMRSDGAPAIDQAIAPTWTGIHTHTKAIPVITGAAGNKVWLGMYSSGSGHTDAPKTLGAASTYLQVGGREYGSLGFAGVGFGYVADSTQNPAVWIGHEEIDTAGNTTGEFVVATRNVTTNTAPTERFRVTKNGAIAVGGSANTGTAGQILTSNGTGSAPSWQAPASSQNFNGNLGAPTHHTNLLTSINASDGMVHICDGSAGDMEIFLPDTPAPGKTFTLIRVNDGAHGFDIHAGSGSLIYGVGIAGVQSVGMASANSYRTLYYDGTNWRIIGSDGS